MPDPAHDDIPTPHGGTGGDHRLGTDISRLGGELGRELSGTYEVEMAALVELGRIASEFLEMDFVQQTFHHAPDLLRGPLAAVLTLAEAIQRAVRPGVFFEPALIDLLRQEMKNLGDVAEEVLLKTRDESERSRYDRQEISVLLARLAAVRSRLSTGDKLEDLARETREAVARSKGAERGQHELSEFFDAYSRSEGKTAEILRILCGSLLVAIAFV